MFFGVQDYLLLPYFWMIVAIVFLLAEIWMPGLFFFVAFSAGFFISAMVALLNISFFWQCWAALFGTVVTFIFLRYFFASKKRSVIKWNTNIDALIGKRGVVIVDIEPNKKGQVRIGGEVWSAIVEDGFVLKKEMIVKVIKIAGNKLVVSPIDNFLKCKK